MLTPRSQDFSIEKGEGLPISTMRFEKRFQCRYSREGLLRNGDGGHPAPGYAGGGGDRAKAKIA